MDATKPGAFSGGSVSALLQIVCTALEAVISFDNFLFKCNNLRFLKFLAAFFVIAVCILIFQIFCSKKLRFLKVLVLKDPYDLKNMIKSPIVN